MLSISHQQQQQQFHWASRGSFQEYQQYYADEIQLLSETSRYYDDCRNVVTPPPPTTISCSGSVSDNNNNNNNNKNKVTSKAVVPKAVKAATTVTIRRTCKIEGCTRSIKAQGLCQRHGARTKTCSSIGCKKQAQGGAGGFCKFHFKNRELVVCVECTSTTEAVSSRVVSPVTVMTDVTNTASKLDSQKLEIVSSAPMVVFDECINDFDKSSCNLASLVDTTTPLEQWEIAIMSDEALLLNEEEIHSPIMQWSDPTADANQFYQMDMNVVTCHDKPIFGEDDIAWESLDAGFVIFLEEEYAVSTNEPIKF